MKNLAKNTTTTAEASNAPTVTTNNTKKKETTNMAHPDEQTATKPKDGLIKVSFTPEELEAAKERIENFSNSTNNGPYTPADEFFENVTMPSFERSRIADIYQVMFNQESADDPSDKSTIADSAPTLCAMLGMIFLQDIMCDQTEGWLKRQMLLLLDDVKRNPQRYDIAPDCDFCHDSYLERQAGFLHDVEHMVSKLPTALAQRLAALANWNYGSVPFPTRFESRIAALWHVASTFDCLLIDITALLEEGAFAEEVASTKLVAEKK